MPTFPYGGLPVQVPHAFPPPQQSVAHAQSSQGARERERRERPGEEEEEGEEKSKEQGPQGGFGAYKNAWFDLVKKNLENGR